MISLGNEYWVAIWAYLSADKGGGVALRVTVASAPVSSGLVQLRETTISRHLTQVERSVHPTRKLGNIHVESELLSSQLKHLIRLLILREQVDARRKLLLAIRREHVESQS